MYRQTKKLRKLPKARNSLGGQNALIDEVSVQFRLTAKRA